MHFHIYLFDLFAYRNEELLIYSNIYSNLSNIIDSVLEYITCNRSILFYNIRESMIKLLSKCEPLLMKWEWYNLQENIDSIPSEYIDCVNEIADEIVNEIKTEFIIDNEDPLKTCKEITNECIYEYKQKICELLNKTEIKRKFYKKKQFGFFMQSFGKILNFIQMYIDSKEMKNERFEDIIKQHVACLLREYMNVIIDRVYKKNYSKCNEHRLDTDEIINESIKRMFIRLVLNSYENAKSELCNVITNMSSDENTSSADITNELLEKRNIHNKLMDKLLRSLPGDGEFEKMLRNEIDRLISKQKDSEFFNGKFIVESSREIFNSLFNDKIFGFINKTNLFNIHIYEQTRDCDISRKHFKQYVIPSLINHSKFQEIFRNILNIKSIKLKSWLRNNCKENRNAKELMKRVVKPILNYMTTMKMQSDNSLRSIVINALDKCIISLDDIFENPSYFMKFVRPFLSNNQSDSYIDEILTVVSEENFASLKIKHNNYEISLQIPVCQIKTIIQLKKSISTQTKIPIQQIYMIKYGEDEISKDKEIMGSICDYLVTFVSSMENTKVMKMLAKGAFGVVYLCEDKLSKYQFVLKKSRSFDINLNRDISINLQLQLSNNFTGFYRVYHFEQSFCIGMEYFSRGSLRSVLNENKRLSERDIAQYSHQILTQINLMHEESISHRDIKPDNVVIDKDNNARLIDFGLSKNMAGLTDKDLLEKLNKYSVGTLGYMAPELIKSETYSEKVDIWSFGIMVGEMSTGKKPFHNMMGLQSAIYVTSSEVINLYLPDDTSEELAQFIYSCLNKNPNERPTAKQLLESRFIRIHTNKNDTIDV